MTAQTFRTDKLIKELEKLFERRLEAFEEMTMAIAKNGVGIESEYHLGQAIGIRRSIYNILLAFDLESLDLYKKNDERFELNYIAEINNPKSEASES